MTAPADPWLTAHEACALLGVSPATLRRWSDAGAVPAFTTPGGHRRFARSSILALLESGTAQVTHPAVPESREARRHRRLTAALRALLDAPSEAERRVAAAAAVDAARQHGEPAGRLTSAQALDRALTSLVLAFTEALVPAVDTAEAARVPDRTAPDSTSPDRKVRTP